MLSLLNLKFYDNNVFYNVKRGIYFYFLSIRTDPPKGEY